MNKCEWRDGKFYPCLNMVGLLEQRNECVGFYGKDGGFYGRGLANYCPSCGEDIRKPEQEVIIKRSGETFVARCDGIDYIDTDPQAGIPRFDLNLLSNKHKWKPFSEVEITDEIAKMRPIVVIKVLKLSVKLYGVESKATAVMGSGYIGPIKSIRFANVDDLIRKIY